MYIGGANEEENNLSEPNDKTINVGQITAYTWNILVIFKWSPLELERQK